MAKNKQRLSKNKQNELLKSLGYSYKDINRMNTATRNKLVDLIISDKEIEKKQKQAKRKGIESPKRKSNKQYLTFKDRVTKKRYYLDSIGINDALVRGKISDKKIDSIKLSDIKNNNVTRDNYPWLYASVFDFNKVYTLKDNKRMFVAFRDYQGELDIETALNQYANRTDKQLLTSLENLVNTPATYMKGVSGSSSGKAGSFKFQVASQNVIAIFNKEAREETGKDKRALTRQNKGKKKRRDKRGHYKGDKVGYQVLKDGRRVSHDRVTPRNLLIVANAIMDNVTEYERVDFYNQFYKDITEHIPDMIKILPKPKY